MTPTPKRKKRAPKAERPANSLSDVLYVDSSGKVWHRALLTETRIAGMCGWRVEKLFGPEE